MNPESQNILLVTEPLYRPLENALTDLGITIQQIHDSRPPESFYGVLGCFVSFYGCLKQPIRHFKLRKLLKQHAIPVIAWNRDAPHYLNKANWRLWLLDHFRLLDIYATHTLIDSRYLFADKRMYLPNAADIKLWCNNVKDVKVEQSYEYDVSFFGGMNGSRYKEDLDRELFFKRLALRLTEEKIRFLFVEASELSTIEQINLVRKSRINLNYGARCEYGASVPSGLPERCYGIPAMGGFLLCDKRTHAITDFTVGVDWAEYDGFEDCVAKIKYWLDHYSQARELAQRTKTTVMAKHTYHHRAQAVILELREWHRIHNNQ